LKILAVYNRKAGGGYTDSVGRKIEKSLCSLGSCVLLSLHEFLKQSRIDVDVVVAVGGDGTVNAVGEKLMGSDVSLVILSFGSGNGLARYLGFTNSISHLKNIIKNNNAKWMDTGEVNGYFFLNVAGVGFEGEIAHHFSVMTKRGFLGYAKQVIKNFKSAKNMSFVIETENVKIELQGLSLSIANGNQWGNDFFIASDANIFDGKFQAVTMTKPKWYQLVSFYRKLKLKKSAVSSKFFKTISSAVFTVKCDSNTWHLDGEPIILKSPVNITVKPKSLKILIP
jgi:diacylglycerol kinase family enzyme